MAHSEQPQCAPRSIACECSRATQSRLQMLAQCILTLILFLPPFLLVVPSLDGMILFSAVVVALCVIVDASHELVVYRNDSEVLNYFHTKANVQELRRLMRAPQPICSRPSAFGAGAHFPLAPSNRTTNVSDFGWRIELSGDAVEPPVVLKKPARRPMAPSPLKDRKKGDAQLRIESAYILLACFIVLAVCNLLMVDYVFGGPIFGATETFTADTRQALQTDPAQAAAPAPAGASEVRHETTC